MRRSLAILKYIPAVLCGLLVAVWVASWFVSCVLEFRPANYVTGRELKTFIFGASTFEYKFDNYGYPAIPYEGAEFSAASRRVGLFDLPDVPGRLLFELSRSTRHDEQLQPIETLFVRLCVPVPVLLTLLMPIGVGCLTRFRFPIWSYFAYTALIAAELAYYR